ncbi:putative LRR receptor-like serine/threonine-protein kinase [Gossypium australe]|uniref:Putative LRR receptor-like serine/threonine-protein kinase n=1 Tax=Gossypium australe TaxID=47621 RepID=A0A5B6WJR1_9ROSI|nr:putative LRR receptor-like serine/threonine-protein kinase [Gossypium australe]
MERHPEQLFSYLSTSASASVSNDQQVLLKDMINRRLSPPVSQSAEDLVSTIYEDSNRMLEW